MMAYWQKRDGERSAYEICFTTAESGRKGWAEYQAALHQIGAINRALKAEGYKLRYVPTPK
jgi:hypothetical protein